MSKVMEEEFKRWTAKRKAVLVTEIIQRETTVAEASRSFDIPPSEIGEWVITFKLPTKIKEFFR